MNIDSDYKIDDLTLIKHLKGVDSSFLSLLRGLSPDRPLFLVNPINAVTCSFYKPYYFWSDTTIFLLFKRSIS